MKYHHGNLRSELIRCACTLCEEHGHDKLSLRGIAKEANVSQTAPYRHFETKESLLAAVAAHGFIEMKKSIDKIIDLSKTNKISKKTLVDGMLAYLDFAISNNNIYEVMFGTVIKDFRNFPDLHDAALDAYSSLKLSVKRYIKLKNDKEYDEKCVKIWAFLHGLVGLNKIEQKLEDVPTTDGSYDMPIDALRAAKNNLVPFMNSSIDALIKS
ncbi:MAG: TetR/AcrR family transcriptional regulator [SAR86 cluster bacterium]|uniref:TetR/AcrR family transcriptional regulator n=1 Tax=SAR86 cluster bacterium TaxID=2030880 RepID=A0A368BYY2_9GAMM|nr:MAG: TetR/AcrR family transcriptional regulator [SAR86 cluster bacterium]